MIYEFFHMIYEFFHMIYEFCSCVATAADIDVN